MALTEIPKELSSTPGIVDNSTGTAITIDSSNNTNFADNAKAIFGAGSDLQIYHDGTNSYISDQGTNDLKVLATDFQLKNSADNEFMMTAVTDGAVTMYHNNAAKLATTATGIDVTGSVTADGLTVDGNDSYTSNIKFDYGASAPTYFANWGYKSSTDGNKVFLTITDAGVAKDVLVANYNGNVGIGTSSPFFTAAGRTSLSVNGTSSSILAFGKGGSSENYILADAGGLTIANTSATLPTTFFNNASNSMTISAAGNVGIGVVPSADSFFKSLEIGNTGSGITGRGAADTHFMSGLIWDGNSTQEYTVSSVAVGKYQITNGIHSWSTAPAGTAGNPATPQTNMILDVSGNLGIGTILLSHPLHITKEIAGYQAYFNNDNGSAQGIKVRVKANDSGNFNILELVSASSGSDVTAMVVRDDGNVGIGTSLPTTPLSVHGDGVVVKIDGDTANTSRTLLFRSVGTAEGIVQTDGNMHFLQEDASRYMRFSTANIERMRIDEFGGLAIKSVGGATTAGFYGGNLVNGITAVPSAAGTPFVLGRDTGTLRSAHFGGNLKFDSGYGVLFGDAGGTGTSTSNTLDSYEEGSFTPLFTSENGTITTGTNVGRYVKVGNLVHCNFNIRSTGVSGISGAIGISGMPFTAHSPSRAGGSIWYMRSWGAALDNLRFGIVGNGSTLTFYTNSANATVASLDNNDFGTGSDDNVLECSIVYRTT